VLTQLVEAKRTFSTLSSTFKRRGGTEHKYNSIEGTLYNFASDILKRLRRGDESGEIPVVGSAGFNPRTHGHVWPYLIIQ